MSEPRMKPIIILPPDAMADDQIQQLRDNGLCVVVAKDPSKVKFLDPIPSAAERTKIEDAAIQLSRKVLATGYWSHNDTRQNLAATFVDILVSGTKLDPKPQREEVERDVFDREKLDEIRRLAREEAKAERAAAKAAKAKEKQAK